MIEHINKYTGLQRLVRRLGIFMLGCMFFGINKPAVSGDMNSIDNAGTCHVRVSGITWDASKYQLRLCLNLNNVRKCFPSSEDIFRLPSGVYSNSFQVKCAQIYRYGFDWELFKGTTPYAKGGDSQIFFTHNDETVSLTRPYFPQIQLEITKDERLFE